jgi:hypothetical protein
LTQTRVERFRSSPQRVDVGMIGGEAGRRGVADGVRLMLDDLAPARVRRPRARTRDGPCTAPVQQCVISPLEVDAALPGGRNSDGNPQRGR